MLERLSQKSTIQKVKYMYPVSSCFLFFVFNPEFFRKKHVPKPWFRRIPLSRRSSSSWRLHINYQRPPIFARFNICLCCQSTTIPGWVEFQRPLFILMGGDKTHTKSKMCWQTNWEWRRCIGRLIHDKLVPRKDDHVGKHFQNDQTVWLSL